MRLFYTHTWIDICMKRKKSQFMNQYLYEMKLRVWLQIDPALFVLGFFFGKIKWHVPYTIASSIAEKCNAHPISSRIRHTFSVFCQESPMRTYY